MQKYWESKPATGKSNFRITWLCYVWDLHLRDTRCIMNKNYLDLMARQETGGVLASGRLFNGLWSKWNGDAAIDSEYISCPKIKDLNIQSPITKTAKPSLVVVLTLTMTKSIVWMEAQWISRKRKNRFPCDKQTQKPVWFHYIRWQGNIWGRKEEEEEI